MKTGPFATTRTLSFKRISEGDHPKDLRTSIKLQSGQGYAKEVKAQTFIEGASIVYVAQGELEKHVEDSAHLESYINSLIFESNEINEIKDSELLFDYQSVSEDLASATPLTHGRQRGHCCARNGNRPPRPRSV